MSNAQRTIEVPSAPTASLTIDTSDGETATMALVLDGVTLALGEDFGAAEVSYWTWLDMPEADVRETFASFLADAFESSDEDAREGWPVLTDEAQD